LELGAGFVGEAPSLASRAVVVEEGYSVLPAGHDKQPWEASAAGNIMDKYDEDEAADTA
jgi:hypothetical protein